VSAVPASHGHTVMLDLGANPDCTADNLVQFAVMGSVIASDLHGVQSPRVGLLNIGEEDIKGTEEIKEAHKRLGGRPINYVGFVEGDDIFSGDVDVVVTDGFTGNVALKTMEGAARFIGGAMREEFTRSPFRKLGAVAAAPALKALKARMDPRIYNGASMVGLNGVVIKSHGGADRVSFANAVRVALTEARNGVPAQISDLLQKVIG
jgi:glycerol-3-phosphate acyltransferase PlsX